MLPHHVSDHKIIQVKVVLQRLGQTELTFKKGQQYKKAMLAFHEKMESPFPYCLHPGHARRLEGSLCLYGGPCAEPLSA